MAVIDKAHYDRIFGVLPFFAAAPVLTSDEDPPMVGVPLTTDIPDATGVDTRLITFYRTDDEGVTVEQVGGSTEYDDGSVLPEPQYTPVVGDIGYKLLVEHSGVNVNVTARRSALTAAVVDTEVEVVVPVVDPDDWTWEQRDFNQTTQIGRARLTLLASAATFGAGWTCGAYRGSVEAGEEQFITNLATLTGEDQNTRPTDWEPTGGALVNATQYCRIYFKHSDNPDTWLQDPHVFSFVTENDDPPIPESGFPLLTADTTVGSVAALHAAVNARIATGLTTQYVINFTGGNYSGIILNGKQAAGLIIIQAATPAGTKTKIFGTTQCRQARNIVFRYCTFDQTTNVDLNNATSLDIRGSDKCGAEFCDFLFGIGAARTDGGLGYNHRGAYGIHAGKDDTGGPGTHVQTSNVYIHMNYFFGNCQVFILLDGLIGTLNRVNHNVFRDVYGDDIKIGNNVNDLEMNYNWGSRRRFTGKPFGGGDWWHTDFIQDWAPLIGGNRRSMIGNVCLKKDWPISEGVPQQGIFSSKSKTNQFTYIDNILSSTGRNGLWVEHGSNGAISTNHLVRDNTNLIPVDDFSMEGQGSQHINNVGGTGHTKSNNVHTSQFVTGGFSQTAGPGALILTRATVENYYTNCRMGSSFYDYRPIAGQPTHWAYLTAADRKGAWNRFKNVIVDGNYPKQGPAAAGWKLEYDPSNQITS